MSTHYREECEYGHTHGQCRCPDKNKAVKKVVCDRPEEHKPRHRAEGESK